MIQAQPITLMHSWPVYEAADQMTWIGQPAPAIGEWCCDLATSALTWSPAVYDLFGLPEDEPLKRSLTVSLYTPESRAAMEELRAYAIRHSRGFTLDAQIRRADGEARWMRLCAVPVFAGRRVVQLRGTKQDVTARYDGAG